MSFDWKLVQSPLEGVTASQLEAVFGSPEVVKIEAGSHISLAAEAPRTAYLVLSGALHGGGQELRLMPELAVPQGEIAGLGRLVVADATEQSFAVGAPTSLLPLDGTLLEALCTAGDPAAQSVFDAVVLCLSVDLRASNEALQTLLQS